ncbi:Cytochrome P450 monooxygenase atmQ [Drechslerella dactyloides]|uniref:Cytochrome P450 monooxygenase atmQ n=1 Tax=Drechslerella dactyloides TaxID=74499 RepID=A0AAD6J167_DREDA|nr:Cytochrome P450 monooxygenase atmQ [Drechslerella dactyloides]
MENDPVVSPTPNDSKVSGSHLTNLVYTCVHALNITEGKRADIALFYLLLLLVPIYGVYRYKKDNIDLPYVGIPPGLFGSWRAGYNFLTRADEIIREGYTKYAPEGKAFVVSTLPRYMVFLTDTDQISELGHVPDSDIGFYEALVEVGQQYVLFLLHTGLIQPITLP